MREKNIKNLVNNHFYHNHRVFTQAILYSVNGIYNLPNSIQRNYEQDVSNEHETHFECDQFQIELRVSFIVFITVFICL